MRLSGVWEATLADVERALDRMTHDAPPALAEAVRAALAVPGKRVRPRVAVLAYHACGGVDAARAVEAAVAVELLHTATLMVDDVLDASAVRRGQPAAWAHAGTDRTLLAAGWLVARASRAGAPSTADAPVDATEDAGALTTAFEDVCAAEARALDGGAVDVDTWMDIARGKTAGLFVLAAEGGARKARSATLAPAMRQYGTYLGLAFQAADDVLDWTGEARALGKPAGQDATNGRPNLVAACGGDVGAARAFATARAEDAARALDAVPASPARDALVALARDAATRAR